MGIYAMYNTPTWADDLKKICDELPASYCLAQTTLTGLGAQTESVQDALYWTYNVIQQRFQDWAPRYQQGEETTDLLDISSIKAPTITLIAG